MTDLPYRPNVCILLFNAEKKLLIAERKGATGVWQLPQGGVELDQSIEDNVLREIEEELGLKASCVEIVGCLKARNRYDFDQPPDYAIGIWQGQDQTFWAVRFLGTDQQINVKTEDAEFESWRWVTSDEILTQVEPKRATGYQSAILEFKRISETLT